MKSAALEYACRGVYVFPCKPNDKEPFRGGHGCNDATTEPEVINRWWTAHPNANIGIATGPSGFVVIDVDVKNGLDGWGAVDAMMRDLGELPGTRSADTPSGGCHMYYRNPGADIGNTVGRESQAVKPGVDIRARGGYVVAPPSVIDGKHYVWTVEMQTATLPDAWVCALQKPKYVPLPSESRPIVERACAYGASALNGEADTVAKATPGTRNDTITSSAFKVGTIADQCGITGAQAEKVFAWAVGHWRDEAEARKAHDSFWRAFGAGRLSPRQLELKSA
jgi:hypothetical protein